MKKYVYSVVAFNYYESGGHAYWDGKSWSSDKEDSFLFLDKKEADDFADTDNGDFVLTHLVDLDWEKHPQENFKK